jgi:hypothetical protein
VKTKLTDKLQEDLAEYLEAGLFITKACEAVGLGETTFFSWLRGTAPRHRQFQARIARARAKAEGDALVCVKRAARDDWRAAAWFLERSFPESWGPQRMNPDTWGSQPPRRVEVTGPEGGPVPVAAAAGVFEIDLEDLPEEALVAIVKQIEERHDDIIDGVSRDADADPGDPAPGPE